MHLLRSVQVLLFPWERISRKRFFWAILGFTAATYLVALLPASPSLFGMQFKPPVMEAVSHFMVITILFLRITAAFYAWWRIYDATLIKWATWIIWVVVTVLWLVLREWAVIVPLYFLLFFLPSKDKEGN